jgi:ribosome-associated protein
MSDDLFVAGTLWLPAGALSQKAVRAGGPGGQNVNKVATKVELRFDAERAPGLSMSARRRLYALAKNQMDSQGRLVVTCDSTRSQAQNLTLAKERLVALVKRALVAPKRRRPTRRTHSSEKKRLDAKRRTSALKRQRRGGDD